MTAFYDVKTFLYHHHHHQYDKVII